MSDTKMARPMSTSRQRVVERAKRDPEGQLRAVAHLLDVDALRRAYDRIRPKAAVGVDGVTKEEYGRVLESNLRSLHVRMREMRYRHQPIRRVRIPKEKGERPIGISSIEDKIVQGALQELLEQLYEPTFMDCSYGFRPRRSAHDALRTLDRALYQGEVNWILEADIQSFFDSIDRKMLQEMLWERIADKSLQRLVGKCLHVGILDGEEYSEPDQGTVQGSVLSPLLGNVYLHHVLDRWFEREVQPRLRGRAMVVRYADDFVIGFALKEDAERVMAVIGKRFARFRLALHPEKTRLFPFRRPVPGQSGDKGPGTFEFLGFVVYWRRTRKGFWTPTLRTRKASLRRAIVSIAEWCRRHRCLPVRQQHAALKRRLVGHYNYFGVNGNGRSLEAVSRQAERNWRKWLRRRSQRTTLNWANYTDFLRAYPLPRPCVRVQLWAAP